VLFSFLSFVPPLSLFPHIPPLDDKSAFLPTVQGKRIVLMSTLTTMTAEEDWYAITTRAATKTGIFFIAHTAWHDIEQLWTFRIRASACMHANQPML
jgi:hypothetical protein